MTQASPKAMVVLQVEAEELHWFMTLIGEALREAYDAGKPQVWGPRHITIDPKDIAMISDIFVEPESGGGYHEVKVEVEFDGVDHQTDWALEHSLRCRRAGVLNCPLTALVGIGVKQGHIGAGSYRIWREAGALLWDEVA